VNKVPSIFDHPWMLSLLLAMPALTVAQLLAAWRNRRLLRRLGDPLTLLSQLPAPPRFAWLTALLFGGGVTALVMGAAGPHWGQEEHPAVVAGRDLVIVLDMSNSMRATDAPPDRFHRAVDAVKTLIDYCRRRGGHRLALVAYAAEAQVVCPLTYDYNHVAMKLESLEMDQAPPALRPRSASQSGTRMGAGLRAAVAVHEGGSSGFQDILLLSDGDDPLNDGEWEAALREIAMTGIPVSAVGIGDANRDTEIRVSGHAGRVKTRLIEKPLQEISRRTAGQYLYAGVEMPRLDEFVRQRLESKGVATPEGDALAAPRIRHAWFYGAAMLMFGLAGLTRFRLSDLGIRLKKDEVEP
jgi:Ca-activated chloride channel family protein